jgi:S-DNA-T family DNA segregation ATPase FtsK/SpoIIIE
VADYWLQVTEPGHPGRVVVVDGELEVGRDSEGLLLDDPTVSRRHLLLDARDGVLVCIDFGSANGTYVNGDRVTDPITLEPGDVVRIGECELVVHEGREVSNQLTGTDGEIVVETLERPSEAVRDLNRASSRGPRRR